MTVWTHGNWVVKAGAEAAFEEAWTRLARPAMRAYKVEPRASDLFRGAVDEIRPLLESFEPFALDEIEWA